MPSLDNTPGSSTTWAKDVRVQTTKSLTTTGGTVWSAAHRCAEFLEIEQSTIGLLKPGLQVLELGAGCGMLGMLVARNVPAARVCLTEQAFGGALAHLQLNVQLNTHLPGMHAVTTRSCDWTHFMNSQLVEAVRHGTLPQLMQGDRLLQQDIIQQQLHHHQQQHTIPASAQEDSLFQQKQEQPCHAAASPQLPARSHAQHQHQEELAQDLSAAELQDMQVLLQTAWDVIIGSDLIYNQAGARGLPKVLAALMGNTVRTSHNSNATAMQQQQQQCSSSSNATVSCCPTQYCISEVVAETHRHPSCSHAQQLQRADMNAHVTDMGESTINTSPHCSKQQHTDGVAGQHTPTQQQQTTVTSSKESSGCSHSGPVMYYAHTKHRFDALDVEFFEQLAAYDLDVMEVVEAGKELPPPSPPAFSSLFPDMRIAVFRISQRQ